ncbi:MAG TPA: tRNA pseudouridine(55) synthase TruB [Candidatus Paceibacterota bacterium]|nr:tRNA pseudouridine(55) synthase TruB [Candidatus Paceibacterota bacterium]
MAETKEIIFIDKPRGITSFGVIAILRRKLGIKRIGHAGTLDPFATGLLIVGIGAGTKKLKEFEALPKTYVMDVFLGKRTDTGDPEGKIIEEKKVGDVESSNVEKILAGMEGELELPIPQYSAVKHKGIRLYKYARRGIKIEQKFRKTEIFKLKLFGVSRSGNNPVLRVEMDCEKGTYARAVGEELGRRLGIPAMLAELRRTKIGDISVDNAKKPEEI